MSQAPSQVQNPVTEEAFTADRQQMFAGFCNATVFAIVTSVVILVGMAAFLL